MTTAAHKVAEKSQRMRNGGGDGDGDGYDARSSRIGLQTETIVYSGAHASMGVDNSSLQSFIKDFNVVVNPLTEDDIEYDMIGIDSALAYAFRRILIFEYMPSLLKPFQALCRRYSVIATVALIWAFAAVLTAAGAFNRISPKTQ